MRNFDYVFILRNQPQKRSRNTNGFRYVLSTLFEHPFYIKAYVRLSGVYDRRRMSPDATTFKVSY